MSAPARLALRMLQSMAGKESMATKQFVVLQHGPHLVPYHGSDTHVPVTLLAIQHQGQALRTALPPRDGLRIDLVRRGWRSGLLGWTAAELLGASTTRGIDVTPAVAYEPGRAPNGASGPPKEHGARTNFDPAVRDKWDRHIAQFIKKQAAANFASVLPGGKVEALVPVATHAVRIPAAAGDGYYRLALRPAKSLGPAVSPDFRVYSLSLASASPRGSALMPPTVVPEMLLQTASTAAYTFFWSLFPVATLMDKFLPRRSGRKTLGWLARVTGVQRRTDSLLHEYNVEQRVETAKDSVMDTVPFSYAAIRTTHDLREDASIGAGGVTYWISPGTNP